VKLWLSGALAALVAPWNLSSPESAELERGAVVVRMAAPTDEAEVVTWSAIRVSTAPEVFRGCAADPSCLFGYEDLLGAGRLGLRPHPQDFDGLELDPSDREQLRRCRVGRCRVRASAGAITRFQQAIDWSQPDAPRLADALFRETLANRAIRYLELGNHGLEAYADRERRSPIAETQGLLLARPLPLLDLAPDVRALLRTAPAPSGSTAQYLAWRKDRFWRQSLVSLDHIAVQQAAGGVVVVAVQQLYASHYFDGAIEVFALLPGPRAEPGLLLHMSRAQADVRGTGLAWYERALLNRLARGRLQRCLTALRDRLSNLPSPGPAPVPLRASR